MTLFARDNRRQEQETGSDVAPLLDSLALGDEDCLLDQVNEDHGGDPVLEPEQILPPEEAQPSSGPCTPRTGWCRKQAAG